MLSLFSYSALFLLLLFPLLFILAFLLFLLLSLLLTFVSILLCFLLCVPIVILFLAIALLLLRFLMFLSPPLIIIGDLGLWPAWLRADSRCYVLGSFTLGQRAAKQNHCQKINPKICKREADYRIIASPLKAWTAASAVFDSGKLTWERLKQITLQRWPTTLGCWLICLILSMGWACSLKSKHLIQLSEESWYLIQLLQK